MCTEALADAGAALDLPRAGGLALFCMCIPLLAAARCSCIRIRCPPLTTHCPSLIAHLLLTTIQDRVPTACHTTPDSLLADSATPLLLRCYPAPTPLLLRSYSAATLLLHCCHSATPLPLRSCSSPTPLLHRSYSAATPFGRWCDSAAHQSLAEAHGLCAATGGTGGSILCA